MLVSSQHRTELVALVPQKALDRAKTRLRVILPKEARVALSMQMLRHVLHVCQETPGLNKLYLCGPADLVPLAGEYGATLLEGGFRGLRRDVAQAAEDRRIGGRAAMLYVSSDLPLLVPDDLTAMIRAWEAGADLVLAPDQRERATNAMLVNVPEEFPYAFGEVLGPGSFHTHRDQAIGHDLRVAEVRRLGLQFDVDLPVDVCEFIRIAPHNPLAQYCAARMSDEFRFE